MGANARKRHGVVERAEKTPTTIYMTKNEKQAVRRKSKELNEALAKKRAEEQRSTKKEETE